MQYAIYRYTRSGRKIKKPVFTIYAKNRDMAWDEFVFHFFRLEDYPEDTCLKIELVRRRKKEVLQEKIEILQTKLSVCLGALKEVSREVGGHIAFIEQCEKCKTRIAKNTLKKLERIK